MQISARCSKTTKSLQTCFGNPLAGTVVIDLEKSSGENSRQKVLKNTILARTLPPE